jgi:voltage-gated potassium channel
VRTFLRRLGQLAGLIALLLLVGTAGFVITEDASVGMGFLWTLDTIATVGSIPNPDSSAAQALKVVLIVLGVGTLFYALVTLTEFFVAGHLSGLLAERRAMKMIDSYRGHHVICGFGRVGRQVGRDLKLAGQRFVAVDIDPEKRDLADELGAPFIEGDVADDESLLEAGVERAASVIACVDSDAQNVYITLTARELRSDVTIVARASQSSAEHKLRRAGADRVISPYKSSGTEMARLAMHPQVPFALTVARNYRIEEIEVTADSASAGSRLGDVAGESRIVALRRAEGDVEMDPGLDTRVGEGDVLVAFGTDGAMDRLEAAFAPPGSVLHEAHPDF